MNDLPGRLTATAEIAVATPDALMSKLAEHFAEHGEVTVEGRTSRIVTNYGTASIEAGAGGLTFHAEGRDDAELAYVKLSLAEHLLEFTDGAEPEIVWRGDEAAGKPLPYFREMRVARVEDISPRMRRITLSGHDLDRFAGFGLHVRLLFPKPGIAPVWPVTGVDGRPFWPRGTDRPQARVYTVRSVDLARGEVDIDFVLHGGDRYPGAGFATSAAAGDIVGMTGPGGGWTPETDWVLLAGDETALPAIGRMLEILPATTRAVVRVEVAGAAEEQALRSDATLDLQWLHRDDAAPGVLLEAAIRAVAMPESGSRFAWVGCEHRAFRAIRAHLRKERNMPRHEHLVVAYWRQGVEGDAARDDDN